MEVMHHESVIVRHRNREDLREAVHAHSELHLITVHIVVGRYFEIVFCLVVVTAAEDTLTLFVSHFINIVLICRAIHNPVAIGIEILTYTPVVCRSREGFVSIY